MTTETVQQEEPTVGKVLSDVDFTASDAMIADYYEGLAIDAPAAGEPVPTMVAGAADNFHGQSAFSQQRGHLWMRQEWELHAPIVPGAHYTAHGAEPLT